MQKGLKSVREMFRVSLQANSSSLRYIFFALSLVFTVALLNFAFFVGSFSDTEKTLITLIGLICFSAGLFALMSD